MPYLLSILHWRCSSLEPGQWLAVVRSFQYSIGDAASIPTLTWWITARSYFQYSIGEAVDITLMCMIAREQRLSILHWRCKEDLLAVVEGARSYSTFNTPLEM